VSAMFKDLVESTDEAHHDTRTPVDRPKPSFLTNHIARHNARQRRADAEALGEQIAPARRW